MSSAKNLKDLEAVSHIENLKISLSVRANNESYEYDSGAQYAVMNLYQLALEGARSIDKSILPKRRTLKKRFHEAVDELMLNHCSPALMKMWIRDTHAETSDGDICTKSLNDEDEIKQDPIGRREKFSSFCSNLYDRYVKWRYPLAVVTGEIPQDIVYKIMTPINENALKICPSQQRKRRIVAELENKQYKFDMLHGLNGFKNIPQL